MIRMKVSFANAFIQLLCSVAKCAGTELVTFLISGLLEIKKHDYFRNKMAYYFIN